MMLTSLGDPELEKKQLMKLYEQQVDAIIVVGGVIDRIAVDEEYVEQLNHILESTPIIATNRPVGVRNCKIHLDAVSYTHLDVYKRQSYGSLQ